MASISRRVVAGTPRYDVNYREPDGRRRRKTFAKKVDADNFARSVEVDKSRGAYIDHDRGRITFKAYADRWIAHQYDATQAGTREAVELRMRLHVYPAIGKYPLSSLDVDVLRGWANRLRGAGLSATYRRTILANVAAILNTAVEDNRIPKNNVRTKSVRDALAASTTTARKVEIWTDDQVRAVRDALPAKYRIALDLGVGLGLRQGEIFGLSPADVDFLRGTVTVKRQVKVLSGNRLILAPLKGRRPGDDDEFRDVPLPSAVRDLLAAFLAEWPARSVSLPFAEVDGVPREADLVLTTREGGALNRNYINTYVWKPALRKAGLEPTRGNGMHALRHRYASVLLTNGAAVQAVAAYMGHRDPSVTLRTYAHVMPSSAERARDVLDEAFACYMGATSDGGSLAAPAADLR